MRCPEQLSRTGARAAKARSTHWSGSGTLDDPPLADARPRRAAVRHRHDHHDLVRSRGIADHDGHRGRHPSIRRRVVPTMYSPTPARYSPLLCRSRMSIWNDQTPRDRTSSYVTTHRGGVYGSLVRRGTMAPDSPIDVGAFKAFEREDYSRVQGIRPSHGVVTSQVNDALLQ